MVKAVHDELFSCISLVLGGVASRVGGGWLSACVIGSVLSSQVLGAAGSFVEQEALGLIFEGRVLLFGHS